MRRDVFQAIADPTRRDIIRLLAERDLPLNAVAEHFPVSRPAISKHIRILHECGLLQITKTGRERRCKANPSRLSEVADWTEHFRSFWSEKLNALGTFLEQEQQQKNANKLKR